MSDRYKIDWRDAKVVMAFIGAAVLAICVLFYFLSQAYYDDRAKDGALLTEAHIRGVRVSFTIFMLSLGATASCAILAPRIIGHSLAAGAGLLAIIGGIAALDRPEVHIVLPVALLVVGTVFALLTWKSLERSRAGWAFLTAMCAVFSVVMLFGATKIRNHLHVGIYYALIVPGLLCVASIALGLVRREYREST